MTSRDAMLLVAAVGHLMLAVLTLVRGGRSTLVRPLALLCLDLFAWNFATLAHHVTGAPFFGWLDASFTALSPPLALHLVVAFVGARREHRRLLQAAYAAFGALAATSAAALFSPWARAWVESPTWAAFFLVGWLPTLGYGLVLLVRHLVRSTDATEKARTRTMLAAIVVGGAFATTDILGGSGFAVPALGSLGTLLGAILVATAVFRFRLFDRDLSVSTALYAAALGVASILTYIVLFARVGGNTAALTLGTGAVTAVVVVAARELVSASSVERERTLRLAALGRLSAQMAHDIRNPLAALVGAAQALDGEMPREEERDFLRLVLEQAQRIRTVVEKYDRLGRVEPILTRVQVNDVAERVVLAQRASAGAIDLRLDLASSLPECDADADLLAGALENLIRNAIEAMPRGGSISVRTRTQGRASLDEAVLLTVTDTGEGMDARRAERAFDDFFTTKKAGSGLGLAFVRRVAIAHGGGATLTRRPGEGTTVELRLPLDEGLRTSRSS